ncbi:high affinity cAMP-specific and IBMX-insensitive 3',5'-cyclic phosphodiesterase 8-like isoform X2 [Planococcus citri]|uniref:high affinity cAMP-specific and IBMX-insensitive 3',5'-cyclic phosphodiesterase 8-like isoform X2 n=1 Tax=Planococcus citri TaxID=170843 RepID=UPI0031F9C05C
MCIRLDYFEVEVPQTLPRRRSIREIKRSRHAVVVAIFKKSLDKDTNNAKALLAAGFNRVLPECSLRSYWMYELTEIHNGEVNLHLILSQTEAICAAVEKSRDYIMITNKNHMIQYMNKSCLSVLGYTVPEVIDKPIRNFDQLSCADQIMRHLDRGFEWEGKVAWKCKNNDVIYANCKASPYRPFGKEASHYIYVHENPQLDSHIFPRGSICSVRKGSYDLKSLSSDGAQSARRQSLAKLNNLPLEAPITKVISLITKAQENSSENVSQVLDKVVDILRTTELYSSHVKSESIKFEDPVTSDLIGALITPGPVPSSFPRRRSSNDSTIRAQFGSLKVNLQLSCSSWVKDVLENPFSWEFDIFKLERLSLHRPLCTLGMNVLLNFQLNKILNVDERVIQNWLVEVERHYHARNPYHNSTHAADVLQAIAVFLKKEKVRKVLDDIDNATCLIAAITHDIGHPARSSAFLCNNGDPLAILYNDISVLESHHASFTFKLTLADDKVNIFKGLDKETYKDLRQSIIDMILATEMTKHFEHLAKFVSVYSKPQTIIDDDKVTGEFGTEYAPLTPEEEVKLMKRMMIKCADVANPTRPLKCCVEWAKRIAEEYFQQTDDEKAKNLPIVMPMFDRATCNIPKSQIGFVDYIVHDMFEAWDAFVGIPEIIHHMRFNYNFWKTLNDRGIISMSKVYCPEILDNLPSSPRVEYLNEILDGNLFTADSISDKPECDRRKNMDKNQENEKNENVRNENSRNSLLEQDETKDYVSENKQSTNEQTQL